MLRANSNIIYNEFFLLRSTSYQLSLPSQANSCSIGLFVQTYINKLPEILPFLILVYVVFATYFVSSTRHDGNAMDMRSLSKRFIFVINICERRKARKLNNKLFIVSKAKVPYNVV